MTFTLLTFCCYFCIISIVIPPAASVAGSKAVFRDGLSILGDSLAY
jgi:hypothetical protein